MFTRGLTILAILLSLPRCVWAGPSYTITELPTSDLGDFVPVAINKHGVVVGAIWGTFGGRIEPRVARWTATGGLELLDPDLPSYPSGVNAHGAIVGA